MAWLTDEQYLQAGLGRLPDAEVAKVLGRTEGGVSVRRRLLHIPTAPRRDWRPIGRRRAGEHSLGLGEEGPVYWTRSERWDSRVLSMQHAGLGRLTDGEVSEATGASMRSVAMARKTLNMPQAQPRWVRSEGPSRREKKQIRQALRNIVYRGKGTHKYPWDPEAIRSKLGDRPSPRHVIDHIRPVCSFDLEDPSHMEAVNHPDNLMWVTKVDNSRKGGSRRPDLEAAWVRDL